jgi:VWFA-related protein
MRIFSSIALLGLAAVPFGVAVLGQGAAQQEGPAISVTVTASAKQGKTTPAIPQSDVVVRQDGNVRRVISWVPADGSKTGLDLIVLVDDGLGSNIANRWSELRDFLRAQPASTREGIAYANFGFVRFEQELTADHDKAAGTLRLPGPTRGENTGIYDAGRDLVKKWPESKNRMAVILISDGLDLSDGASDTDPDRNIPLQQLIDQAQQADVTFYAIFARGSREPPEGSHIFDNAQGSLARLARETGGQSYYDGFSSPVSLQPYLQDIGQLLGQQYILTFAAKSGKKADYSGLKVVLETKNVEILAPDRVFVPGAQ